METPNALPALEVAPIAEVNLMRVVVTGGGTGGHIYPAMAVAQAMQGDPAVAAVAYFGKTGGLESELVPKAGIPFEGLSFYGMPRQRNLSLPFKLVQWFLQLRRARASAKSLLQAFRPDVVFGTGGYVSAPVLMAAKALKIPYVVHEPDAQPGLVNRLMSRDAALITTSFRQGADRLKHRPEQAVIVTGNPIRGDIGQKPSGETLAQLGITLKPGSPVLLVTGGSQGARRINQAVVDALPTLIDQWGWTVLHVTGKNLYEETRQRLNDAHPAFLSRTNYWLQPYSDAMAALLAIADLAICRAGSLSLSEMYVSGVPTVLIPYPFAASDHQRKNAQASVASGASLMLEDADCTGEGLITLLAPYAHDPARLAPLCEAALRLAHPNATAEIVATLKAFAPEKPS